MCLFKKLFLKFFTGNWLQVSSNRLHSYILKGHDFSNWISKSFIACNQLHINGNRLQLLNSNFKTLLKTDFSKLSSGSRLHCLVIDYLSLDLLETLCFEAKAWSWINLEAMLVCWSNLVLILKQCLTFECLLK